MGSRRADDVVMASRRPTSLVAVSAVSALAFVASLFVVVGPATTANAAASSNSTTAEAEVTRLYLAYFGRLPDAAGLAYWIDVRRSGSSLEAVSANFADSAEFRGRYGSLSDRQFVELVYRNVLQRNGDQSGLNYWTGELQTGAARGELMVGFSESPEFIRRAANRRTPTKVGPEAEQSPANAGLEALRNRNPLFDRYADRPASQIGLGTPGLMSAANKPDNGSVGDGQFRAACEYSHFAYDDPIVYPGQPGASHLHMFFGNTETDAHSTTDTLVNSGGGSCNGFELNRSAYWTPALLDGRGNAVVPDRIILYYKTKKPSEVESMPQGLKMVVGNTTDETFEKSNYLYWSCGRSGVVRSKSNRIQACNEGEWLNATIAFPQCWDGRLDSPDHRSHMYLVPPESPCPASHPRRLPQISILLYFPGGQSVAGWHLSSDRQGGFNAMPGGTLHADWWGGWNDDAMDLWTDGCMKAVRNCSFGQTGTSNRLAAVSSLEIYQGNNYLSLPS